MEKTIAIILAAGQGTRMKSDIPKVLHKVSGDTMLEHVIDSCNKANIDEIYVVVGHKAEIIKEQTGDNVNYILQKEQLGTGHAVLQAKNVLDRNECNILILMGDAPLITTDTISKMLRKHNNDNNGATVLTARVQEPNGYGRIIKDHKDNISKIVEQKDATDTELSINEINSGMYCFNSQKLSECLDNLSNNNSQKEYYLTDIVEIMNCKEYKVGSFQTVEDDILAVNSRVQLAQIQKILQKRINEKLMDDGVTIINPENTYIGKDVIVGKDTLIYPGTIIEGKVCIGERCIIGANSRIENSIIKDEVEIQNSTILNSEIDRNTKVGPYAYIRPNCKIGKRVKIGDFVEVKNSTIGDDTKASHLTYIGDAQIGSKVNLGCGVVFVNYDGSNKYLTIVEDECFIGCNVNLIAPVTIKEGSFIAAGSTITENVPKDSLAIARPKQTNKIDYMNNEK